MYMLLQLAVLDFESNLRQREMTESAQGGTDLIGCTLRVGNTLVRGDNIFRCYRVYLMQESSKPKLVLRPALAGHPRNDQRPSNKARSVEGRRDRVLHPSAARGC